MSAADEVFEQLAGEILSGALLPGSHLPPERELAERFGVSRLIVRQATHRLSEMGLLHVRQGGATAVGDPAESPHPEVGVLALRFSPARRTDYYRLCERQIVGALPMLVLAEKNIGPDDTSALFEMVAEHEAGKLDLGTFEERYWTKIADIGQNPFYRRDTRFWFQVLRSEPSKRHPEIGSLMQRASMYREVTRRLEQKENAAEAYLIVVRAALDTLERFEKAEIRESAAAQSERS